MARKIEVQDLIAKGISKEKAEEIVRDLNAPKPKSAWIMCKVDQQTAEKIASAFPLVMFTPRYKVRVKKEKTPKNGGANKGQQSPPK